VRNETVSYTVRYETVSFNPFSDGPLRADSCERTIRATPALGARSAAVTREVGMNDPRPAQHVLDAALKRRAEMLGTTRSLTLALEAPSPGREAAWMQRVAGCLEALRSDMAEHIETTEAPDGVHHEMVTAAPRLANPVQRLVADHEVLHERIARCHAMATHADATADAALVKAVRDDATQVVALLQRHRQRSSDLIYEAYNTDIGGAD